MIIFLQYIHVREIQYDDLSNISNIFIKYSPELPSEGELGRIFHVFFHIFFQSHTHALKLSPIMPQPHYLQSDIIMAYVSFRRTYGSGHEGAAFLLPGFAIKW